MPQQLIYTSSPRGLAVGRSGYCTVACSEGMREALQTRLEQFSYFEHGVLAGNCHPEVCAYRVLDLRGTRFHCLTRIVDAGLDFTKRTNFTAHHLVFTPAEVANLPPPPIIFLHWNGWRDAWTGEPQWLTQENWGNLSSLSVPALIPCRNWQALTGDAANAALWLEPRPESFIADGFDHQRTLALLAESLALEASRPGGGSAWLTPFTTFLQEGDDAAEFRCRLVYTGTSAYARLTARGGLLVSLRDARAKAVDEGIAAVARAGLRILHQPEDQTAFQNERMGLRVEATASVALTYQWHRCSPEGEPLKAIAGATAPELKCDRLKVGYNYFCVVVRGAGGCVQSRVARIAVRAAIHRPSPTVTVPLISTPDTVEGVEPGGADEPVTRGQRPVLRGSPTTFNEEVSTPMVETSRNKWNWPLVATCSFLVVFTILLVLLFRTNSDGKIGAQELRITQNTPAPKEESLSSRQSASIQGQGIKPLKGADSNATDSGPSGATPLPQPRLILVVVPPKGCDCSSLSATNNAIQKKEKSRAEKQAELVRIEKQINTNWHIVQKALIKWDQHFQGLADLTNGLAKELTQWEKKPRTPMELMDISKRLGRSAIDVGSYFEQTAPFVQSNHGITRNFELLRTAGDKLPKAISQICKDDTEIEPLRRAKNNLEETLEAYRKRNMSSLTHKLGNPPIHSASVYQNQIAADDLSGTNSPVASSEWTNVSFAGSVIQLTPTPTNLKYFSITELNVITNRITDPFFITLSVINPPSQKPLVKLLIWPSGLCATASCDPTGKIQVQLKPEIIKSLHDLKEEGKYKLQVELSYGDDKKNPCATNYSELSTHYSFSQLPERLVQWNKQLASVNSLLLLKKQADKGGVSIPKATKTWKDLNSVFEQLIYGRVVSGTEYDFESDPSTALAKVRDDLQSDRIIPPVDKSNWLELLNAVDCLSLEGILSNKDSSQPSLEGAQKRLAGYAGKDGRPNTDHLNMTISASAGNSDQNVVLVRAEFR